MDFTNPVIGRNNIKKICPFTTTTLNLALLVEQRTKNLFWCWCFRMNMVQMISSMKIRWRRRRLPSSPLPRKKRTCLNDWHVQFHPLLLFYLWPLRVCWTLRYGKPVGVWRTNKDRNWYVSLHDACSAMEMVNPLTMRLASTTGSWWELQLGSSHDLSCYSLTD